MYISSFLHSPCPVVATVPPLQGGQPTPVYKLPRSFWLQNLLIQAVTEVRASDLCKEALKLLDKLDSQTALSEGELGIV